MAPNIICPASFHEASLALEALGPSARLISGGTDLFVQQRRSGRPAGPLVDISRVGDDSAHTVQVQGGEVLVGALVTFQQLAESMLLREALPALWQAANIMGSQQIRRRGTLGGNMAHASPAGDSLPPLLVAGARVLLATPTGHRELPVDKLFLGPGRTTLEHGQVITGVRFPLVPEGRSGFVRVGSRAHHVITKVSLAMAAQVVEGRWQHVRVALGAVAPFPMRALAAEAVLEGQVPNAALLDAAGTAAANAARPIDDIRSNGDYRRAMCQELVAMVAAQMLATPAST